MSGLFRYNINSLNASPSAAGSSGRHLPVNSAAGIASSTPNNTMSPFKTTPPVGLFGKSPAGSNYFLNAESPHSFNQSSACSSPNKLKSVREMEDLLDSLQKENFNLKMKMFYMEDMNGVKPQDRDYHKQIVELKVQLAEKTEAVAQASNAIKFMDTRHCKNEENMAILKCRIQELEECLRQNNTSSTKTADCSASPKGVHLNESCKTDVVENPKLKALEQENECLKKELERLQECVQDLCKQLDNLCEQDSNNHSKDSLDCSPKADRKKRDCSADSKQSYCASELKKDDCATKKDDCAPKNTRRTCSPLDLRTGGSPERKMKCEKMEAMCCEIEKLKKEISDLKNVLEKTCQNLECAKAQLLEEKKKGADLFCENEELLEKLEKSEAGLEKATKIVEKLMKNNGTATANLTPPTRDNDPCFNFDASSAAGDDGGDSIVCELKRIIREKNAELLELKANMCKEGKSAKCIEQELTPKRAEVSRLSQIVACHEQKARLHSWDSTRTVKTCDMTTLSNCTAGDSANESMVRRLEEELKCQKQCLEEAELKTLKMMEVVTILRLRLEEIAGFLKSLMEHKDLLSSLCRERVQAMEKAVDRSLNLTSSMDVSCINMSVGNMTNISKLIGDFSLNLDVSCDDGLNQTNTNTVDALRNEILSLRGELEKAYKKKECDRKDRKSLPCPATKNGSDSEWSGPDVNVSKERMGIEVQNAKNCIVISSSDDDACGGSGSKKSIMERMLKYEREIEARDNKVLEVKLAMVELEACLKQEQVLHCESAKNLTQCKELNACLEKEVCELKKKLSDSLVEKELLESKLKYQEEKFQKEILFKMEQETQQLNKKLGEMREKCCKDIVDKEEELKCKQKEICEQRERLEQKDKEVCTVRLKLTECCKQLDCLKEKETEWCTELLCSEDKVAKLKKSLDELTISATRAAVERTKAVNERDKVCEDKKELEAKYDCLLEERIRLKDRLFETDRLNTELCDQLKCVTTQSRASRGAGSAKECDATSGYGSEEARPSSPERATTVARTEVADCKDHDCDQVECENQELKRRLAHLKRTLEHTFNKLKMSNQMKEKVERDIQQQLIKTNNVLKLARNNLENRPN